MPVVQFSTRIAAPIAVCFDLARSIALHIESVPRSGERAVAGVTSGLIGMNQEVTWEATHLGVRQRLTSRITAFDPPRYFRDSMVRGAFKRFDHDHFFEEHDGVTLMTDRFEFASPLGWLGRVVDSLFLERYMRQLLIGRAAVIKATAERWPSKSLQ